MAARPTISAILISRNEEENIAECLATLSFCDETIIVDSGSSDRTVEIARDLGASVHVNADWPGFGVQKQRALDLATCDWVLSVDADERIPDGLRREIEAAVAGSRYCGFRLTRLSWFLGQPMRHGGWYPDRIVRLARREKAHFTPVAVHEELLVKGEVGQLREPMIHHSYRTIDDVMSKMHQYALAAAESRRRDGRAGGLFVAISRSLFSFFKAYVLRAGLLDGRRGFVAAVAGAQQTFWRYLATGWEKPS